VLMLLPPEKTVSSLINSGSGTLQTLVTQAMELKQLNELLQQYVSEELAPHCKVVGFEQGCLTLATSNGNYATLLRYQVSELLSALRREPNFCGLGSIKVQVSAVSAPLVKKPEEKVERAISVEASNSLLSAAEGIENPAIKEALEKLAGK